MNCTLASFLLAINAAMFTSFLVGKAKRILDGGLYEMRLTDTDLRIDDAY